MRCSTRRRTLARSTGLCARTPHWQTTSLCYLSGRHRLYHHTHSHPQSHRNNRNNVLPRRPPLPAHIPPDRRSANSKHTTDSAAPNHPNSRRDQCRPTAGEEQVRAADGLARRTQDGALLGADHEGTRTPDTGHRHVKRQHPLESRDITRTEWSCMNEQDRIG